MHAYNTYFAYSFRCRSRVFECFCHIWQLLKCMSALTSFMLMRSAAYNKLNLGCRCSCERTIEGQIREISVVHVLFVFVLTAPLDCNLDSITVSYHHYFLLNSYYGQTDALSYPGAMFSFSKMQLNICVFVKNSCERGC